VKTKPFTPHSDMVNNTTWATPLCFGATSNEKSFWMLRASDGNDVVGPPWALEHVAEGQAWYDIVGGSRTPTGLLDGKHKSALVEIFAVEKLPIRDSKDWRAVQTRRMCLLWCNEKSSGTRLLEAEKRVGEETFLSQLLLIEKTPAGWMRKFGREGVLVKAEES
jgi:hypothetical protein